MGETGPFSRVLAKVQQQQLGFGIYMLMRMILTHTTDLEDISRKVFSAHSVN
jgi:hypothetical protein